MINPPGSPTRDNSRSTKARNSQDISPGFELIWSEMILFDLDDAFSSYFSYRSVDPAATAEADRWCGFAGTNLRFGSSGLGVGGEVKGE